MKEKSDLLQPDGIYHIYNRTNGGEKLFLSKDNYLFFLRKYARYIDVVADTFCYCLMPNHFHFLVRIKPEVVLKITFKEKLEKKKENLQGFGNLGGLISKQEKENYQGLQKNLGDLISKQFSNFFNSYTKAFNKQHQRNGSLFSQNFKRIEVKDEAYFRKLVHYIHYNPIEAGFTRQYDWEYSSYPAIVSKQKTKVLREEVIRYFDDLENFKYCHKYPPKITGIEDIS